MTKFVPTVAARPISPVVLSSIASAQHLSTIRLCAHALCSRFTLNFTTHHAIRSVSDMFQANCNPPSNSSRSPLLPSHSPALLFQFRPRFIISPQATVCSYSHHLFRFYTASCQFPFAFIGLQLKLHARAHWSRQRP
jgi:hypothetical protein